jgi:hypothetical protein
MRPWLLLFAVATCMATQGFSQRRQKSQLRPSRPAFGHVGYRNVATANFPQLVVINGSGALGSGFEYERFILKEGYISLQLPFCVNAAIGHLGAISEGERFSRASSWYFAPGIRLHPLGNAHRADPSIGMQLAAGSLDMKKGRFTNFGAEKIESDVQYSLVAAMASVGLNLHPSDHFVIGMYFGAGAMLSDTDKQKGGLFQFGLKLGGRF